MVIQKYKPKERWDTDVQWRFALFPVRDHRNDLFWLEPYWVTGDGIRWYTRGRKKEFPTRKSFWTAVWVTGVKY